MQLFAAIFGLVVIIGVSAFAGYAAGRSSERRTRKGTSPLTASASSTTPTSSDW